MTKTYSTLPALSEKDIQRFWSKVKIDSVDRCWEWQGGKDKAGYGSIGIEHPKRLLRAHRVSYFLAYNIDPEILFVLHSCDNPACVNPKHLFLGNQQDNIRDMVAKNRQAKGDRQGLRLHPEKAARGNRSGAYTHPEKRLFGDKNPTRLYPEIVRGERNNQAKLTEKQVLEIRKRHSEENIGYGSLAKQYKMSKYAICAIVKRKTWRHI